MAKEKPVTTSPQETTIVSDQHAPIAIVKQFGLTVHPMGTYNGRTLRVLSSLDPTTDSGKLLLASVELAYKSILDTSGVPIPVVDLVCWDKVEVNRHTGEEGVVTRTGFIAQDGTVHATSSGEMGDKLDVLCRYFGPPPWQKPIWLVFGESKAKQSGQMYHWFRPVAAPPGV